MLCPVCSAAQLEVINSSYYCPNCKIYIGKVNALNDANSSSTQDTVNAPDSLVNYFQEKQIKKALGEKEYASSHKSFMKAVFITAFLLIVFGALIFRSYLYVDLQNSCMITIIPTWSEFTNPNIKKSLSVLKNVSPSDYQNVCHRLRSISTHSSCGGSEGGCFSDIKSKTIDVPTNSRNLPMIVATIVHETCHVRQRDEGRDFVEQECYREGDRIFKMIMVY